MRLRYSKLALRDLDRILEYIEERSTTGAINLGARLQTAIDLLREYPFAGAAARRGRTRRFVLSPYPYVVLYRVGADEIVIQAIRHAARRRG